jgi:hypothetical protein
MDILSESEAAADVRLSRQELVLLNNALNEVCHGIDVPEFHTPAAPGVAGPSDRD